MERIINTIECGDSILVKGTRSNGVTVDCQCKLDERGRRVVKVINHTSTSNSRIAKVVSKYYR